MSRRVQSSSRGISTVATMLMCGAVSGCTTPMPDRFEQRTIEVPLVTESLTYDFEGAGSDSASYSSNLTIEIDIAGPT